MVSVIDDPAFDGWGPQQLVAAFAPGGHAILLAADATTMAHPERVVLCLDLAGAGKPFRVTLPQLWAVENNLSLANLDYDDFAGAADAEGVFRGFE